MRAMVLTRAGAGELEAIERELPIALPGELLIKVRACGVCRTDLHVVDGELPDAEIPLIPGHEIVGVVEQIGDSVDGFKVGDRVGIPWLGYSCGQCARARGATKTCARTRASSATTPTAAMPTTPSSTPAIPSSCRIRTATSTRRRCSAPGSSATARIA